MREKRTVQSSIFEQYAEHEIGRELKAMSDWLDTHLNLLDWVAPYLVIKFGSFYCVTHFAYILFDIHVVLLLG
jgi:IS5 family transposase